MYSSNLAITGDNGMPIYISVFLVSPCLSLDRGTIAKSKILNDVREGLYVIRDSAWSRGLSAVADLLVCSGQGRNTQSNTDGPRFSANLDQILACGFLKIPRKVIRTPKAVCATRWIADKIRE